MNYPNFIANPHIPKFYNVQYNPKKIKNKKLHSKSNTPTHNENSSMLVV